MWSLKRHPDFIIGESSNPYLLRWYLIPRNHWFNVYLHKFLRDDDDRALHDHPWLSVSLVLSGGYYDVTLGPDGTQQRKWIRPGSLVFRWAQTAHRVELGKGPETYEIGYCTNDWHDGGIPMPRKQIAAWTLFITGPKVREWGFLCPRGWRHWREFTDGKDGQRIGRGCD